MYHKITYRIKCIVVGIFTPWLECALRQECIAPVGAARPQHQFEQSTLSIFALQHRISKRAILELENINANLYTETTGPESTTMRARLVS